MGSSSAVGSDKRCWGFLFVWCWRGGNYGYQLTGIIDGGFLFYLIHDGSLGVAGGRRAEGHVVIY